MKNEIEARIAELERRIDTYKKVASSDADIIKKLLTSSNPEDIRFAADKAEAIVRHIVRIPGNGSRNQKTASKTQRGEIIMEAEIQKLIDSPAEMQTVLNLKQLDRLIHNLTATYGQTITMKYSIRQGRSETLFESESEQDLVNSSGIFSKVLSSCKLNIFGSCLTYTPEGGYKVWMRAGVSYESFDHGHNGMAIATRWFEDRK